MTTVEPRVGQPRPPRARRHIVCKVDDIPDGGRRIVEIAGRSLGIFNVGGRFHALLNRCPHNGAALCEGPMSTVVVAERPGETTFDTGRTLIQCPWHGWEFDVSTGLSYTEPDRSRVRHYESEVTDGASLSCGVEQGEVGNSTVATQPVVSGPIHRTLLRDRNAPPPQAERFDVTVEDEYVVVTLR